MATVTDKTATSPEPRAGGIILETMRARRCSLLEAFMNFGVGSAESLKRSGIWGSGKLIP